ncbi:hypothetical protein CRUP_034166 [Coryphaenoides rupestris]|nr:hypothetical protein CRUP_034166 [Coryphaenoides rupestris]
MPELKTWSSFDCDCSGTGHSGATCHSALYEPSCEAYKLTGSSSGYYSIDPDGSGPLGPTRVYCNMTARYRNFSSTASKPYVMKFNYSASPEQLRAIVTAAEQCQQEVVYRCRKSRLFNIQDGAPAGLVADQAGERRTYWAGSLPGIRQCFLSNDTGVLSYQDHLPVSQIVIGDTNRTGSEAVYHVGVLRCYGDKSMWNAASFYQDSSYLRFLNLQAELGSDISFYFKTSAPSGIFLENLGLKDFIRVELSCECGALAFAVHPTHVHTAPLTTSSIRNVTSPPSAVAFSFNVGNGPVVLSVKSHVPLNDRQWHYVRAERNVREASLQVDQLPLRFLEAPADGHLRLRLNSHLFVGGTASRQRGFLGCIRTLAVNGVNFNLDERARMTPGVSSGCPGYCSGSSSLCHNRGRCIEKSSGFVCDCSQSAYGGPSCREASSPPSGRAMLLSVSTFSQQYIAVILATNGSLQLWYHLVADKDPDVFIPIRQNLADGRRQHIHREVLQAGSKGFVGCLSSVQFNHLAPLKVALLNRGSSLVRIRGPVEESNCGAVAESTTSHSILDEATEERDDKEKRSDTAATNDGSAVIGGVVAVTAVTAILVALGALTALGHFLHQRQELRRRKSLQEKEARQGKALWGDQNCLL